MKKHVIPYSTFLIAFLEGCAVLSTELIGAKILATYYGSSFVVWTSIIGITLTGLTIGYYLGAWLSNKKEINFFLWFLFFLSACFIVTIPFVATKVMLACYQFGLKTGVVIATTILFGPVLISLGSTSPLLIQNNTLQIISSGKVAGWVYACSTAGGIFSSFLLGFWLIPQWGMKIPLLSTAIVILIGISILLFNFKYLLANVLLIIVIVFLLSSKLFVSSTSTSYSKTKLLYDSEGMLGQLKVFDKNVEGKLPTRYLTLNSIIQTKNVNIPTLPNSNGVSLWKYPHFISIISSLKKSPGATSLICGFGGGAIASELQKLDFKMDIVELDKRVIDIGINYFSFNPNHSTFIIDDARHYIRTTVKQYDLIVIDLLNGEVQPSYIFTIQSFNELKKIIRPDGIIIINYQGPVDIQQGIAVQSIINTLSHSDMHSYYWSLAEDLVADVLFYASPNEIEFSNLSLEKINQCCKMNGNLSGFLQKPVLKHNPFYKNAYLLDDDQPLLENLNAEAIMKWRKSMNELVHEQLNENISLFK